MPNFSGAAGTTQPYLSTVAAGQLHRFAGIPQIYATVTTLNTAVTIERANIATAPNIAVWPDGQLFVVSSEPVGTFRRWDGTAKHAKTVVLRPGLTRVLEGDANTVLSSTGQPSDAVGSNGDLAIDYSLGTVYIKIGFIGGGGGWNLLLSNIFGGSVSTEFNPPTANPQNAVVLFDRSATGGNTASGSSTVFTYDFPSTGTFHFNMNFNSIGEVISISAWGAGASGLVGGY